MRFVGGPLDGQRRTVFDSVASGVSYIERDGTGHRVFYKLERICGEFGDAVFYVPHGQRIDDTLALLIAGYRTP